MAYEIITIKLGSIITYDANNEGELVIAQVDYSLGFCWDQTFFFNGFLFL